MTRIDSFSIEHLLKMAGYGHRRTPKSQNTGEHEVYSLKDSHVVGLMDAHEAASFAGAILKRERK